MTARSEKFFDHFQDWYFTFNLEINLANKIHATMHVIWWFCLLSSPSRINFSCEWMNEKNAKMLNKAWNKHKAMTNKQRDARPSSGCDKLEPKKTFAATSFNHFLKKFPFVFLTIYRNSNVWWWTSKVTTREGDEKPENFTKIFIQQTKWEF